MVRDSSVSAEFLVVSKDLIGDAGNGRVPEPLGLVCFYSVPARMPRNRPNCIPLPACNSTIVALVGLGLQGAGDGFDSF